MNEHSSSSSSSSTTSSSSSSSSSSSPHDPPSSTPTVSQQQQQQNLQPQQSGSSPTDLDQTISALDQEIQQQTEPNRECPSAVIDGNADQQQQDDKTSISACSKLLSEIQTCLQNIKSHDDTNNLEDKISEINDFILEAKKLLSLESEKLAVSEKKSEDERAQLSIDGSNLGELLIQIIYEIYDISIRCNSHSNKQQKTNKNNVRDKMDTSETSEEDVHEEQHQGSSDNVKIGAKKLKITSSSSSIVRTLSNEFTINSTDESSSQDDDSEPILNLLFKEQQTTDEINCDASNDGTQDQVADTTAAIAQRLKLLISELINLMNASLIDELDSNNLPSCSQEDLTELQLNILGKLIKKLDEDNWNEDDDIVEFIKALNIYCRNLLTSRSFNDEQDSIATAKFVALIAIAETVLIITLKETATDVCDTNKLNFTDLFTLLTTLTSLDRCKNHTILLRSAIRWLELCRKYLHNYRIFAHQPTIDSLTDRIKIILDSTCCLSGYVSSILDLLNYISTISSNKMPDVEAQNELQGNSQSDWVDEGPCFNIGEDDDESVVDDSDDESICNKLCTFTLTQKEFVNQHWYHCHTCNMVDRNGICTICAKVCHKDHDISYAKFGAFFCDCAGRENSTCMALVKRAPASPEGELNPCETIGGSNSHMLKSDFSSKDKKLDLPNLTTTSSVGSCNNRDASNEQIKKLTAIQQKLAKQLEPYKNELLSILNEFNSTSMTMEMLSTLVPAYIQFAQNESLVGRSRRARAALENLHSRQKTFHMTEALMLPTLGSQEGAFENVRVNYMGEHASVIKTLLSSNTLRRVAMTSLSSPLGRRQHLVVCHEKGKITLLQLNALLRQADSSKKKLTLTRLASAPIPFSVISIAANPFNEDVLAVCGLKDCHVLTFTQSGLVSSHIELNLDLTGAIDHVIKAVWIPASQTEIAILTSETVKIFDLSGDSLIPRYNLKLAFGQLKDMTFIVPESGKTRHILVMDTAGHIFRQELDTKASSSYGLFYVTTEFQIPHPSITEKDGRVQGGGVSVYYSHSFKMLFFSYTNGNYTASMPTPTEVKRVFPLEFESSNQAFSPPTTTHSSYASAAASATSTTRDSETNQPEQTPKSTNIRHHHGSNTSQPLCQWSEVPGHVGMLLAVFQHSNNPVIFMIRPDCIVAQEIRYLTIKSKITDATAIRHTTSSGEVRTTLILLCEDGSLRIYMASQELTDFWLKLSPIPNMSLGLTPSSFLAKMSRRKKLVGKSSRKSSHTGTCTSFPVDFFENLQIMNDIEFAGNDVLSVYSVQQLKNRLNTPTQHVTCTKATGFSIDVINNDNNMVICGVRVQVGTQEVSKSPTSIEIFGRTTQTSPLTPRWYDLPLTRDESLQAEKGLTIIFGPSADPNHVTTVDSIKIYGKTKESFPWPDEGEEQVSSSSISGDDLVAIFMGQELGSRFQKLMIQSLESLQYCLSLGLCQKVDYKSAQESLAKELSTSLLTVPYPPLLLKTIKSLLLTIYSTRQNYNNHRDAAALDFIIKSLASFKRDQIDCELFSRVIFFMKSLCQSKLTNLTRLSDSLAIILIKREPSLEASLTNENSKIELLIKHLHELFWHLYSQRPANINLASVASTSFINYEDTLQPLIELIYVATLHDLSILTVATDVIIGFLLSEDLSISLCARHTLIRLLRAKGGQQSEPINEHQRGQTTKLSLDVAPEPTQSVQQTASNPNLAGLPIPDANPSAQSTTPERYDQLAEQAQSSSLVGSQPSSIASQLRNVLRDHIEGNRQDNEDDIAIAIALSLQDDSQNNSVTDNAVTAPPTISGRSELNFLSDRMPSAEELMSDTTASGVASDEEISSSGPKSSSVQKAGNQSLDLVQSTSNQDSMVRQTAAGQDSKSTPPVDQDQSKQTDNDDFRMNEQMRLRKQHLMLLERLIEHLPDTREAGGLRSISLLHVILVLTLDLDCDNEVDDAILKNLLHALREELLWNSGQAELLIKRNPTNEVKLVIMRMFSILMSKVRTSSVATTMSSSTKAETNSGWSTFCSSITAASLIESNVLDFCYNVLKHLIEYWRQAAVSNPSLAEPISGSSAQDLIVPVNRRTLPKLSSQTLAPDLSPFFQRAYAKGQNSDVFDDHSQLLTEMVLRIPYQIKKVSSSSSNSLKPVGFSNEWPTILCEYLMVPIPSFIKKHVRKLLTSICGSKEKYRQLRDFHFLESHMNSVKMICGFSADDFKLEDGEHDSKTISLNYESMTSLVEHLKACIEIAQNRCINWQIYCLLKDQSLLSFLMRISLEFGDDVSPNILELLQHALSSSPLAQAHNSSNLLETPMISTTTIEPTNEQQQTFRDTLTSESLSANLGQQLITSISNELLSKFTQTFLLETNMTSLRWQAHSLLYNLCSNFTPTQQRETLLVFWSLWHNLPKYGRKASQYVDIVGFMTLRSSQSDTEYDGMFCTEAINVLKQQNKLLINHQNANIYSSIQGLVDLESYYLESEPCPVCNSPEVAYNNIKLGSIKVDSRFTTTTQIIKLIGSHTILKFSLRISDIKRSKMVKTISIFYNNRSVQSVVELKNKTGIWSLARKYSLSPGQSDVKIEFTLPIVACNLMIEFSEFYENFQASSETLQCPRCSTSVSANPGVCSNCGENVFQCHKCRAINYDEKDPFLCISCGFCKYARFDISLTAKPTCAVDPIENEEDRKKTVASISALLEKADRVYKNLMQNKPTLELSLLRIHEQVVPDRQFDDSILNADHGSPPSNGAGSGPGASNSSGPATGAMQGQSIVVGYAPTSAPSAMNSSVNKAIQHLAQKYCVECKGLFEELSKITHKVLASKRELVEYDNRQLRRCLNAGSSVLSSANRRKSRVYSSLSSGSGKCYGCATATVEHCVTMLKALSTIPKLRTQICDSGIINELVNFNLRNGPSVIGQEIRQLLCSLTRDDLNSTTTLTDLLIDKIEAISKQDYQPFEISHIVRHEIALLSVTLDTDDRCWELRLRCLVKLFAFAFELKNPTVMECLMIPCLKLLLSIVRPPTPTTRRHKEKSLENIASVRSDDYRPRVSLQVWLNDINFIFEDWRRRATKPTNLAQGSKQLKSISSVLRKTSKAQSRCNYLAEKYGNRWRMKSGKYNNQHHANNPIASLPNGWLKRLLFNRSSKTIRLMAKSLVEALFSVQSRRGEIIDLLTTYLDEIGPSGECAQEFYYLYKTIILSDHWRYYLAFQGILFKLGDLITKEIDNLQELEETTLNSSLSLGYSLKMLLELLTSFVAVPKIRSHYKSKLVGLVLKGYLSLRKLVVQRTIVIDESQEMLLELLEDMTTGSESETAAFINVCVEAIKNCHESDIRTPVFIFERLCSTIHPEENAHSEFFVSLEKDPQQEDYLQGRMLGNPYSSNEAGIGPLMKDIKNKICQDCELLALLEDDTSMELLVANKIICLDLPVRDVYKRIWCPENHESDAMRIVYRMRGLLGDATEEFIESLDSRTNEAVDEEQVFKMANNMAPSGGLGVMLDRLKQIDDLSPPFKPLLDVILKLFNHCTKTRNNRLELMKPELQTIKTLLNTLKLALNESDFLDLAGLPMLISSQQTSSGLTNNKPIVHSTPGPRTSVVDQILNITETILREASQQPKANFNKFCSEACGSIEDITFLLVAAQSLSFRLPHVSHKIIQVLPFLVLGDQSKMSALIDFFRPSTDFEKFDQEHSALNDITIDLFCIMVDAIERNENGNQLKDFIVSERIVEKSMNYLTSYAPPLKSSLLATSEEWRDFTSRPALKYVLRILGGLSQGHASTQVLISRDCIPIVHGLEQVSSDAHVGTLAENLLEAIKKHPSVAEKIELVRRQTKEDKKRLAMAVRERQLGALGMKANERGQVTAKSKLLEQCLDLAEDTGLICNICREGYKFQPTKVLGIYTYTKRCVLDEFEMKPRKSYGYTTVTHFNTVHVECHMSAVRSARGRDEWDSAALQNANTRCNGLLPIWGPQVPESAYASALSRHNSYLQDSSGYRDIGYHSTVHDIKLQLLRFAQERSFSEDTGGGGPQSNIHLLPYMMQTALYVLNSTKAATREYKRALNYLEMSSNEALENCYEVDSPYYWCTLAPLVLSPTWWKKKRTQFLQRLIACNHVRRVSIKPPAPIGDTRVRAYAYYKSALIFFGFIDSFYSILFKDVPTDDRWNQDWSASVAEYLKNNDQTVNDNIEVLLNLYQNSLLPCTSLERYFEIIRVDEVTQPSEFIINTLESI